MFERLFASNSRPCFKNAEWDRIKLDLSGCKFEISLPPHEGTFPEEEHGTTFNIFDADRYEYWDRPARRRTTISKTGFFKGGPLNRKFRTYGPVWDAGYIGTLKCSLYVMDSSKMEQSLNCFNRQQLEYLARYDAYYSWGPGFGHSEYACPVNWCVLDIKNNEWIYSEAWNKKAEWANPDPNKDSQFYVRLVTPIFSDKYLLLDFRSIGSLPAEPSNKLMMSRIEKIIQSVSVTLTADSQNEQLGFSSTQYSANRELEKWQYYESFEYDIGGLKFHGECSPPPKLKNEVVIPAQAGIQNLANQAHTSATPKQDKTYHV